MLQVDIHMNGEHVEQYQFPDIPMSEYMTQNVTPPSRVVETPLPGGDYSFRLEELAYTRSGDKGNSANVGTTTHLYCQFYHVRVEFMIIVHSIGTKPHLY